jgi:hypothetical protein
MKHLDRLCTEPGRALLLGIVMAVVIAGYLGFAT